MKPKFAIALLLASLFVIPVGALAQSAPTASGFGPMDDAQIQAAINRGNAKKHDVGLTITDVDTSDFAGMGCHNCGEIYYSVTIYSPLQWIELQAASAKAANRKFTLEDVTPAMREPVLHVASKELRNNLNLTADGVAAKITKVEIADQAKTATVAPLTTKISDQTGVKNTEFTGYVSTSTASSLFSLDALAPIMSNDKTEFYVVLTVEGRTKFEKLKVKDVKHAINEGCKACNARPWPI